MSKPESLTSGQSGTSPAEIPAPESAESSLYCSAEYHLTALGSVVAMAIYTLALRLSCKTGRFSPSTRTLAQYFKVEQRTICVAIHRLVKNGWFEKLTADPGKSVVYGPIQHKTWELTNPGQCIQKLHYPWSAEKSDELGRALYAQADFRHKIYPNILRGLRNTGHSDEAIEHHFTQFWPTDSRKKGVWGRFKEYLETRPVRKNLSEQAPSRAEANHCNG